MITEQILWYDIVHIGGSDKMHNRQTHFLCQQSGSQISKISTRHGNDYISIFVRWQLLECTPGWEGNWTHDCFLVFAWGDRHLVAVNYAPNQSQCHARLPFADLGGKQWRLQDQLSAVGCDWNGDDLQGRGLYLDMAPWQAAVFSLKAL